MKQEDKIKFIEELTRWDNNNLLNEEGLPNRIADGWSADAIYKDRLLRDDNAIEAALEEVDHLLIRYNRLYWDTRSSPNTPNELEEVTLKLAKKHGVRIALMPYVDERQSWEKPYRMMNPDRAMYIVELNFI